MKILKLVAIFFIFCFSANITTGEDNEKSFTMKEIVVTAPKAEDNIPEYVEDVISQDKISQPSVSDSILNSLGNQAGMQLKRSAIGGSGSSELRIRGFSETRLKILRDGTSIQRDGSYGNGPVDWSILSGEDVERIEIHRGAGSAKFGNTFGGVVNIITKKPSKKPKTKITNVYGKFDTWDSKISHRWKAGPLGWSVAASHYETDGYLRNNFVDRNNFSAKLSLDLPMNFEIGAGFDYSDLETGMAVYNRLYNKDGTLNSFYDSSKPDADEGEIGGPGVSSILKEGQYGDESKTEDENISFNAYLTKAFENGYAKLSYIQWNQDRQEYFYDAADSSKKIYERETDAEDNNWTIKGDVEINLEKHKIEFGGESRHYGWGDQTISYIDDLSFNPGPPFVQNGFKGQPDCLIYHAVYAQDLWKIHPDMDLEFGLRGEWFKADSIDPAAFGFPSNATQASIDESKIDPRIALTYRPSKNNSITGRFGIVHRYPTSSEYFWWYLNKSTDYFNEDLKVEEAKQYELSFKQSLFDFMNIIVRGYYYDISDYISSISVSGKGTVPYNIGDVEIKGTEIELSFNLPYDFRLWTNFTWQEGDKDNDPWDENNNLTNQLSDFPEKMFNIGLDYNYKEKITANLSLNYVDSREHFNDKQLVNLGSYTLVNFSGSYRFWETKWSKWKVLLAAENILDQDYEEEEGYPMPGASLIGGIEVSF
ncbi:iron complex outermembrane recepter protein [Candidatus Magnetomoraceae bacterium gMMP-15]